MNEIGKELATELLNTLKGTKAFVLEQAPDVVRQLINWKIGSHAFGIVVLVAVLVAVVVGYRKIWRHFEAKRELDGPEVFFSSIIGGVLALVLFLAALDDAQALLQLVIAPKIYLIEYLTKLVSRG